MSFRLKKNLFNFKHFLIILTMPRVVAVAGKA